MGSGLYSSNASLSLSKTSLSFFVGLGRSNPDCCEVDLSSNNSNTRCLISFLCDFGSTYISASTDRLKEFTPKVNRAYNGVLHLLHNATGNWKLDDTSKTDMPVATTALVSGQGKYVLPTDLLSIERVEIKDQNDNWIRVNPIIEKNIPGAIPEFHDVDGDPMYYTLVGNVLELYPAPDYSQDASLKVYYKRTGVEFTYDDTTKEPGFVPLYHRILPIKASIEWYKVKQPTSPTLQVLMADEAKLEAQIVEHYGKRFKDYKPKITRAYDNYK